MAETTIRAPRTAIRCYDFGLSLIASPSSWLTEAAHARRHLRYSRDTLLYRTCTPRSPNRAKQEPVLRIRRMGVCGTDLHIFQGKHPYLEYPRVMGHELSGEIAAAGTAAGWPRVMPVYVMPYLTCGRCIACRQGKTNCCTTLQCLGVHCDGGMCDYLALPAGLVFPTDGLPLDQAALVEFLAIGAHAARRAEIRGGERTLVVGAGPIGIATALFARSRGAEMTFLDPRADRLAFCRDVLGLGDGLLADADTRERLRDLTAATSSISCSMPPAMPPRWSRASAGWRMAGRSCSWAWCAPISASPAPTFTSAS